MTDAAASIAFFGAGNMGLPMIVNLLNEGYRVTVWDPDPARRHRAAEAGARAGVSPETCLAAAETVVMSLPHGQPWETFVQTVLIPAAVPGRTVIDVGTASPPKTRAAAKRLGARGVGFLDVPVSGGPGGVRSGTLRLFAGGDRGVFERLLPVLRGIGGASCTVTYCGPSGSGQVVKGVNQLMMGLGNAAFLEAVAFGVNSGIGADVLARAVGGTGRWRGDFTAVAEAVASGRGKDVEVKFHELPYFLEESAEREHASPLAEILYLFCDKGRRVVEDHGRPTPSFWHELRRETSE